MNIIFLNKMSLRSLYYNISTQKGRSLSHPLTILDSGLRPCLGNINSSEWARSISMLPLPRSCAAFLNIRYYFPFRIYFRPVKLRIRSKTLGRAKSNMLIQIAMESYIVYIYIYACYKFILNYDIYIIFIYIILYINLKLYWKKILV